MDSPEIHGVWPRPLRHCCELRGAGKLFCADILGADSPPLLRTTGRLRHRRMDPTLSASASPSGSQQNRDKSAAVGSARFRPNPPPHRGLDSSYKLLGPTTSPSTPPFFRSCSNGIYCATAHRAGGYSCHRGIHTSRSNQCPAWRLEFWPSSVVDATDVLDRVNRWWRVNSSPEHQSTVNPPIAVGADYRRSFLGYVTPTAFATFHTTHTRRRLGFGRRIALG
jgi:hypothetical protein